MLPRDHAHPPRPGHQPLAAHRHLPGARARSGRRAGRRRAPGAAAAPAAGHAHGPARRDQHLAPLSRLHARTSAMDEKNDLSDRVLSDLFAPPKASPSPEPEKRSRGRPTGTKAPLLAPTTSLHLEDFYFLRSVINGLNAREAYERY